MNIFTCSKRARMLDINLIRNEPEKVKENIKKKFQDDKLPLVDELLKKDAEVKKLMKDAQDLRQKRNSLSKDINEAKKKGNDIKKILADAKSVPDKIKKIEDKQAKLQLRVKEILYILPNMIHESVPSGKDERFSPSYQNLYLSPQKKPGHFCYPFPEGKSSLNKQLILRPGICYAWQ